MKAVLVDEHKNLVWTDVADPVIQFSFGIQKNHLNVPIVPGKNRSR